MSERVFMMLPRECFVFFCTARQLSTDLESPEISRRQENPRSHIFVFVVTAFSVVACALSHACSFVSHPSLRTAQTGRDHSFGRCV